MELSPHSWRIRAVNCPGKTGRTSFVHAHRPQTAIAGISGDLRQILRIRHLPSDKAIFGIVRELFHRSRIELAFLVPGHVGTLHPVEDVLIRIRRVWRIKRFVRGAIAFTPIGFLESHGQIFMELSKFLTPEEYVRLQPHRSRAFPC